MTSYTSIQTSKTGLKVPFVNNIPLHSKYDPVKEAEAFAQAVTPSPFFIILGIGGGYHIKALRSKYPDSPVIAVESSIENIKYLSGQGCLFELEKDSSVIITDTDNLALNLKKAFLPVIYDSYSIIPLRQWTMLFKDSYREIPDIIKEALDEIAVDFATQGRFGKIWQSNILNNLRLSSRTKPVKSTYPLQKTAAIIAAGPTLDKSCAHLKEHRENYYIISTDTAISAITDRGIIPDAAVSIDAQNISRRHFMTSLDKDTLFVMDISCDASVCRYLDENGHKIIWAQTGHPLSLYAEDKGGKNSFIELNSGSGTVTVAACDFAIKNGFTKIEMFGADFAMSLGKSYTKGTYLDKIYSLESSRLNPSETIYDRLMYRSKISKTQDSTYTTDLLTSYKKSFESFMKRQGYTLQDGIYINKSNTQSHTPHEFDYESFIKSYTQEIKLVTDDNLTETQAGLTTLPLKAFTIMHNSK